MLFDLDGTLTDPKVGILNCIKYALTRLDVPAPADIILESYIGPPLQHSFAAMLGPDRVELVEQAVAFYRERYTTEGLFENEVYPGIVDLLQHMRQRAGALYVATSKPTLYARRIIDHFGLARFFDDVYGSELDGMRSNKTDLIAYILTQETIAADAAVMIGDRSHDIVGARGNGVRALGVLWGYGSREELMRAGADRIFDTPGALRSLA